MSITPVFRLLFSFLGILTILSFSSCGGYRDKVIQHYMIYIVDADGKTISHLRSIVDDLNDTAKLVGDQRLEITDNAAAANSTMTLVDNLASTENRSAETVGLGQWVAETDEDGALTHLDGSRPVRTTEYGMKLEYDKQYVTDRLTATDATKKAQLKTLIWHEIGHGLFMNHVQQEDDVMYPDISDPTKDYNGFATRAAAAFNQ